MPPHALARARVIGGKARAGAGFADKLQRLASPGVHEPALPDVEDPARAMPLVQAQVQPAGKGELHLVAVGVDARRGHGLRHRHVRQAAQARERLHDLLALPEKLSPVIEVLPGAAAAHAEMRALRRCGLGRGRKRLQGDRLGKTLFHPRHPGLDRGPRQPAVHEHHKPFHTGHALSAERQPVHGKRQFHVFAYVHCGLMRDARPGRKTPPRRAQ